MKELENNLRKGDKIEIVKQTKKEYQKILEGVIVRQKGHTVFSCNVITGEIKPAEYTIQAINFIDASSGNLSMHRELIIEPDCIYIPALNAANALKKFNKNKTQSYYYKKESPSSLNEHFI